MPKFTKEELDEIKKNTEKVERDRNNKADKKDKKAKKKKRAKKPEKLAPFPERIVGLVLLLISVVVSYLVLRFYS
jgi:hypothetical protein